MADIANTSNIALKQPRVFFDRRFSTYWLSVAGNGPCVAVVAITTVCDEIVYDCCII